MLEIAQRVVRFLGRSDQPVELDPDRLGGSAITATAIANACGGPLWLASDRAKRK